MSHRISRRSMLKQATAASAAAAIPAHGLAQTSASDPFVNLDRHAAQTLEAFVARLIPSDENGPGAAEAGAARYIDRALSNALAASLDSYRSGLAALDTYSSNSQSRPFIELAADEQDAVLQVLERNEADGFTFGSATFFDLVLSHTIEGTFSDPSYGGNRDFIGWEMLGYPGIRLAVSSADQTMDAAVASTRISAYDLPMFNDDDPAGDESGGDSGAQGAP